MEQTLWESIQRLAPLRPRFVSVTYGADGSTRERTHNVVSRILHETTLTPAPHLTCVGAPARRDPRRRARLLGRGSASHRGAARRPPPGQALRAAPAGFRVCRGPGARAARRRRFRHLGGGVPGGAPRGAERAVRPRQPAREDRRGRDARDHAILFRHRHVPALSRPLRGRRHRRRRSCPGILPITRFPHMLRFAQALRRQRAGVAGPSLRRARRRSGDAPHDRGAASRSSRCAACSSTASASSTSTR